jgi:sulfoxide reductase heme-binding subunit YedZ
MDLTRYTKWLKPPVFLLCLAPILNLSWKFYNVATRGTFDLGGNPQATIRNSLGTWTLVFLCVTLAITPARRLLHQNWLIRFRRMVGLFAFFYGSVHLITYILFDTGLDFSMVIRDIYMRPFITMGVTSFVTMLPLAITSTSGWVRRMGGKRWQMLHRLIYISAIAGVIHYYWLVKSDITVPVRFAVVVAILLGYRVVHYVMERKRRSSPPTKPAIKPSAVSA